LKPSRFRWEPGIDYAHMGLAMQSNKTQTAVI